MKDLYKNIGLTTTSSDLGLIRRAIEGCDASHVIKEASRHILLDQKRKDVYDRNHKILTTIGHIRSELGLNRTKLWLECNCLDFDFELSIPSKQREQSPSPVSDKDNIVDIRPNVIYRLIIYISMFARRILIGIGIMLMVVLVFFVFSIGFTYISPSTDVPFSLKTNISSSNKTPTHTRSGSNDATGRSQSPTQAQKPVTKFSGTARPFPTNGYIMRYHTSQAVAPLEIITRKNSNNYYVKLVEASTGQTILTVFIGDGQKINIDVPLGSYILKYSAGETWYGIDDLFGPDTVYCKADEIFTFSQNGNNISGYTVELFLQRNGNLEVTSIPQSDF